MVPSREVTINQNTEVFHKMFLFERSQYLSVIVIHFKGYVVIRLSLKGMKNDKIRFACVKYNLFVLSLSQTFLSSSADRDPEAHA